MTDSPKNIIGLVFYPGMTSLDIIGPQQVFSGLPGVQIHRIWKTLDPVKTDDVEVGTERVVIDRNRITGGGVTAGIDFGLTIASILYGEEIAKITQLLIEYNPAPPFDTGSPEKAGTELVNKAMLFMQGMMPDLVVAK
jgi:cyclohexyl-isocyanide hydratase